MYPARCKLSLTARGARGDQRISVISSTSSNTTSGIVSDRVHSEDEPDTAPASTECLPRLTENTSHSGVQCGVVNGANGDVEDRSLPSSPVSAVDGKHARSNRIDINRILITIIPLALHLTSSLTLCTPVSGWTRLSYCVPSVPLDNSVTHSCVEIESQNLEAKRNFMM